MQQIHSKQELQRSKRQQSKIGVRVETCMVYNGYVTTKMRRGIVTRSEDINKIVDFFTTTTF